MEFSRLMSNLSTFSFRTLHRSCPQTNGDRNQNVWANWRGERDAEYF
jgi:hypothetical protein